MSNNPADVLHTFFSDTEIDHRKKYSLVGLAAALDDLRTEMIAWDKLGRAEESRMFLTAIDRWTQGVYSAFSGQNGLAPVNGPQPTEGDIDLLVMLSDKLGNVEPTFTEAQRTSIREMTDDVLNGLLADKSLPEALRHHLASLVLEVQHCLVDWEIEGDFKLAAAVERLIGAIQIADSQTAANNTTWTDIRDKWLIPLGVALIASAPQTYFAIEALQVAITS